MSRTQIQLVMLLFTLAGLASCFKAPDDPVTNPGGKPPATRTYHWPAIADSAQFGLTSAYWNAAGKYFTLQPGGSAFNNNYWPNAHALDALTDAYLRKDKDAAVKQRMDDLIEGVRTANGGTYLNDYYDDMAWMMIATLRAAAATGDARYRTVADGLWTDVKGGWDNAAGGGFYWRKDRANKNTPANAPACLFAARLYQASKNADDLAWANRTYDWLKANLIRPNGDVWDGLNTNV
ncbi:MAG TPA: glycoside hydrolase family 76 protein, partial [Cytophagales bacterium]